MAKQPRDAPQELGFGAGRGEGDADPSSGLDDAPGDLKQAQPQTS